MKILYVAYWGLLEPLGQSLILPAVKKIGRKGIHLTLITFEKPRDVEAQGNLTWLKAELLRDNVDWRPLKYHKTPTIPATVFDLWHGLMVGLLAGRHDVMHGRTFIGGLIGALLGALTGKPYIYHGEGFWTDQQIEGGFWQPGSRVYKICKALEKWMYRRADGLILLSERTRELIADFPGVAKRSAPAIVVPSCVDLDRFTPGANVRDKNPGRLIYIGSLGGRYRIEPLGWFLQAMLEYDGDWELEILTQSETGPIGQILNEIGILAAKVHISQVSHSQVPDRLRTGSVGLYFLEGGIGALTCSPTKIGEYLACGLPVVASTGSGDTDDILSRNRVGIVVDEMTAPACRIAAAQLQELMKEDYISVRCRQAAEDHYSLDRGVEVQIKLYGEVRQGKCIEGAWSGG